MQVYPDRFTQSLRDGLKGCYLVFGDEPQQKFEILQALRTTAKQAGFEERTVLVADGEFSWSRLIDATQSMSLFAARQLIELELPTGKPGTEGAGILTELASTLSVDTLLIIHGPRIGKDVQKTKWFKALDATGVFTLCYPLEGNQLHKWIQQRLQGEGFQFTPASVKLIADFSEGNLMAAAQEIEKLSLAYPDKQLNEERLASALVDQSRFNVFQLVDIMLQGDRNRCVKILQRLESEGIEPNIIIWALIREWQTLWKLNHLQQTGQTITWPRLGIWKNRQGYYQQAMQRLSKNELTAIGEQLSEADLLFKQTTVIRPYIKLCHLCLLFTGVPLAHMAFAESADLS
ncbi:DNA polymerase III subunit delta [Alteromonas lipolytica]|uniref:DNA polymerase III subunit delta n=1 Tax=Alteromonas lipolytica TaxID=1856405 RepID=A0A1E8FHS8_9ALTE|nr:DNA polymerase III subunit delta [Alteromonas lipolytica]OFI35033.1 DNA polymerase III subunit delta [Alteromonas lipolytica]GGF56056.1 DNA polymerase III subunit delta [Alteromonas lipolytica]